jgi:geranylgeranyl diphosphate synthase type II
MKMDFSLELKNTAELVDQIVKAQLPEITGQQKTVLEAMQYSVNAGGKRLRPMLMLKSFSLICSTA